MAENTGACAPSAERPKAVQDRGEDWSDPATRYYATHGLYSASSWSPEAALALVRSMQSFAEELERG